MNSATLVMDSCVTETPGYQLDCNLSNNSQVNKTVSTKLVIEELQLLNDQLRKQVLDLVEEGDQLKKRLKESVHENDLLQSQLSTYEAAELESFGVLEF